MSDARTAERTAIASRARKMAGIIRQLPARVVASFRKKDVTQRVAELKAIESEVAFGMLPVIGWIERNRSADTAQLMLRRMYEVLHEGAACASMEVPEYADGSISRISGKASDGAARTATLAVTTKVLAAHLEDWARTIEGAEETPEKKQPPYSIRLDGETYRLRFLDETGSYALHGNKSLGWLARLLIQPNRKFSVADLRGDPEKKLQAEDRFGTERIADLPAIKAVKARLQEIEDIMEETGGSERLEEERDTLLDQLKVGERAKKIMSPLKREHHNIATQIRQLLKKLGKKGMPKLSVHLAACIKLDFPQFQYCPPSDIRWES